MSEHEESFHPLPQKQHDTLDLVSKHDQAIKSIGSRQDWTFTFVIAILVVCVIGYLTFLYTEFNNTTTAYRDFSTKEKELNDQRLQNLEYRLENLEERLVPTLTPYPAP